jgi:hypothetical protein
MSNLMDTRRLLEPPACWRGPQAIVNEWVRWCCLAVGQSLESLSARLTRLTPLGLSGDRGFDAVCTVGVTIHVTATDDDADTTLRATIGIDAGAARAIVDAVVSQLCGFRSAGVLTDAFRTVLEHVALDIVDQLTVAGGLAGAVVYEGCTWGQASTSCNGELIRLHVGALGGLLSVTLDPSSTRRSGVLPATLSADATNAPDLPIALALRAPRLCVPVSDIEAMSEGDALYAGFTDARSANAGFRLVTENGWDLGSAVVRHYSPTALEASCNPARVVPDADADIDPADIVTLRPLHGSVHMTQSDLRALMDLGPSGTPPTIRLETRPAASTPIRLFHQHRPIATAELVRLDGEAAYRLLAIDRALLQR